MSDQLAASRDPHLALRAVQHLASGPPPSSATPAVAVGNWRWVVRQRLGDLRQALLVVAVDAEDGARNRSRSALVDRAARSANAVLGTPDLEGFREELRRLVADVATWLAAGAVRSAT